MSEMQSVEAYDIAGQDDEEMSPEVEQNLNGNEAGRAFAMRHIIEKINLFIDEYRRNGYSDEFIGGFIDGVNDVTGGYISLGGSEESDEGSLTEAE